MTSRTWTRSRGQTELDFLIGMSLFLLTVGFVFAFVPSLFEPFSTSGTDNAIVADRTVSHLSADVLGSPASPGALLLAETEEYFDSAADDCAPDDLGLERRHNLNVTLESGGAIETLNGTTLACGPSPSDHSDVTVSQRIVTIDNERYTLYARVW